MATHSVMHCPHIARLSEFLADFDQVGDMEDAATASLLHPFLRRTSLKRIRSFDARKTRLSLYECYLTSGKTGGWTRIVMDDFRARNQTTLRKHPCIESSSQYERLTHQKWKEQLSDYSFNWVYWSRGIRDLYLCEP